MLLVSHKEKFVAILYSDHDLLYERVVGPRVMNFADIQNPLSLEPGQRPILVCHQSERQRIFLLVNL
jgi:hypothetical protein